MKKEDCFFCGEPVDVEDEYEPQGCCDGWECACMGMIVNPVICEKCNDAIAVLDDK